MIAGAGVRSKPILADIKVEMSFGKRTTEEMIVECYGSGDGILTVEADRSFRLSYEESGTSVKESIAIHEIKARAHEDMNLRVRDV